MENQKYLSLSQAAKQIPTSNGRPPSTMSLFRWCTIGVRGVRLEHLRFGRRIVTTPQALDDFARALAAVWAQEPAPPPAPTVNRTPKARTPEQRQRDLDACQARLQKLGVGQ